MRVRFEKLKRVRVRLRLVCKTNYYTGCGCGCSCRAPNKMGEDVDAVEVNITLHNFFLIFIKKTTCFLD